MAPSPDIILHIGRHKSGTTAIQRTLAANPEPLARQGWRYAATGRHDDAHHIAAMAFLDPDQRLFPQVADAGPMLHDLSRELNSSGDEGVIISSEAFQFLRDPSRAAAVIPPDRTHLIVYLREPYAYARSAYAQEIKMGRPMGTFEAYLDAFDPDYEGFLTSWRDAYAPQRMTVAVYDRAQMSGGDVVDDFLDRAGLSGEGLVRVHDANVSIGGPLLEFMRLLAVSEVLSTRQRRAVRDAARSLAADRADFRARPWAPPDVVDAYRRRFEAGHARIARDWLPPGQTLAASSDFEPPPPSMDEAAAFGEIWTLLLRSEPRLCAKIVKQLGAAAANGSIDARRLAQARP